MAQPTAGYGMNKIWRVLLFTETLIFGLFGMYAVMFPLRALETHRHYANLMNWGGPTSTVASNSLQMYVQLSGALAFSLAILSFIAFIDRDVNFARMNSISKSWLGFILLYYSYFGHSKATTGSVTTFKGLLPIATYCLIHSLLLYSTSGTLVWIKDRFSNLSRNLATGPSTTRSNIQVTRVHAE